MKKRRLLYWLATVTVAILLIPLAQWWSRGKTKAIAAACVAAMRERDWQTAHNLADQWARRSPDDAEAWLNLAEVARNLGDLEATAECLGRVPKSDRRFLRTQMLRGDLLLDGLNRPFEAVKVWKSMLVVAPNASVAHQRLLYVYSMTLQRRLLVEQIRDAIRNRAEPPESYGYMLSAPNLMFSDGYLKVGQWLQADPENEILRVAQAVFAARTSPTRGVSMFGAKSVQPGDDAAVIACLEDFPENLELKAFLIEKHIASGSMDELGKALQSLPPNAETDGRFWRYIGVYRDFQRRHADAKEAFLRSLKLHMMDWRAHHELGAIERVLGNSELAEKHAELGNRGKQLERKIMELPNAAQAETPLLTEILEYSRDCGDTEVANGLAYRLNIPVESHRPAN
ncbi:MAG: tetratricopeptide repeat protein [Planctomycetaceae bacterium]